MQGFEAQEPAAPEALKQELAALYSDPRNLAHKANAERQANLRQWEGLHRQAVAAARQQGYAYESGQLFTPQAVAAREAVQAYLEARKTLLKDGEMPVYSQEKIAELLVEDRERLALTVVNGLEQPDKLRDHITWRQNNVTPFAYAAYVQAILKAAEYGLALPEYALAGNSSAAITQGVQRFKRYMALLARQQQIQQRLEAKYKAWVRATGDNHRAPNSLVEVECNMWRSLEDKARQLYQEASQAISSSTPRLHLLWEPERFAPKPVESLVKGDFPLREVSLPNTPDRPLQHLSSADLQQLYDPTLAGLGKPNAEGKADVKLSGENKQAEDRSDSAFKDWLLNMGSARVKDQQSDWFDAQGCFDVELFRNYLEAKGYRVKTLDDEGMRKDWGQRLRQVLFADDVRNQLRLFDASPQAQLVRLLSPPRSSLYGNVKAESGLSLEGFKAEAELSLDIDLARGEVELGKIDLPERRAAQSIKAAYTDYQGQRAELDLGRFSLHLSARAWGFAGASLLLAAKVQLARDKTGYGTTLSAVQPAEREGNTATRVDNAQSGQLVTGKGANVKIEDGAVASFNLFAGVQAGIKVTGALNWAPPAQLAELRRAPSLGMSTDDGWLSLARLEASGAVAAGLGMQREINLSLTKGTLLLRIKASVVAGAGASGSLDFAVGYEAVVDLINLVRRALRDNQYRRLDWVDPIAFEFISRLTLLGGAGLDVSIVYMLGMDIVMSLYEALTSAGRGGPIAYQLLSHRDQEALRCWFVGAPPEALGPMLMTLLSDPKAFEVEQGDEGADLMEDKKSSYDKAGCHLLQQTAIERILTWILRDAKGKNRMQEAMAQFAEACSRMNRFGAKVENQGQAYCEARLRMDQFMAVNVMSFGGQAKRNSDMRARYRVSVLELGAGSDEFCTRSEYYGKTYLPGVRAVYTGEGQ
ncbi:hypothetical protein KSS94_19970 [Pseudomonas fakonensis]|uniref:Uncharacterized protein n=1 Tax=Pseudomonas fakonensis TaxID=2842355 RepID=A0ABX8N2N6_9PSED|nr:hypothetical protein [Pseudomonas fakonensis]QXH50207.1 hypothetical protein KSS94_19970 [Pseudomonas fakonensis]